MKAIFENDMERGRGHACLRLAEVADMAAGNWRFSLCRASDQTYLGRSGWQNSEDFMEPETYTANEQELVLRIGPSVVDNLDVNENYRLSLVGEGAAPQRAVLAITSLNSSMMGATDKLAAAQPQKAAPVPAPEPEPEPQPEPEPAPEPELLPEPPAPTQAKSSLPIILLALLLIGAAAGGAWWYTQQKAKPEQAKAEAAEQKAEQPKPEQAKPEEKPAEAPKAEEPKKEAPKAEAKPEEPKAEAPKAAEPKAEAPRPAPAPQPAPASARDQVRQFFGGTPGGPAAMELYGKLPTASPEEQDAAYRLLLFAADEKQEAAYTPLARSVDPTAPAFGSISKDAAEAWSWYAKAAPNNPEAAQALQNLKGWLEAEAAKGNQKAIDWINKIAADAAAKK